MPRASLISSLVISAVYVDFSLQALLDLFLVLQKQAGQGGVTLITVASLPRSESRLLISSCLLNTGCRMVRKQITFTFSRTLRLFTRFDRILTLFRCVLSD
jgi:hypothetical protein